MKTLLNHHDWHLGHVRVLRYDDGSLGLFIQGRDIQFREDGTVVGAGMALDYCGDVDCGRCAETRQPPSEPLLGEGEDRRGE